MTTLRSSDGRSIWEHSGSGGPGRGAHGSIRATTAIVGGGVTGATLAVLLAEQGEDVVVVHAAPTGRTTARSTAKVSVQHGLRYADLTRTRGEGAARTYATAMGAGLELVLELVDRHALDCDLRRVPALVCARTPASIDRVTEEVAAARAAGVVAHLTRGVSGPIGWALALEVPDQIELDPVAYVDGLLAAAAKLGARIHRDTHVRAVDEGSDTVRLSTTGAVIEAERVVLATLFPIVDTGGFFARTHAVRAPVVACEHPAPLPASYLHLDGDVRSVRSLPLADGRHGVLVVGPSERAPWSRSMAEQLTELEACARAAIPLGKRLARWSAHDYETFDGLPFIGRAPLRNRIDIATGFAKWGFSHGTVAALLLADRPFPGAADWRRLVAAHRRPGLGELARAAVEGSPVAARTTVDNIAGWIRRHRPGGGAGGDATDPPRCPHMGCATRRNDVEGTWDCPCHGSRFASDGTVLAGPALAPLPLDAAAATDR